MCVFVRNLVASIYSMRGVKYRRGVCFISGGPIFPTVGPHNALQARAIGGPTRRAAARRSKPRCSRWARSASDAIIVISTRGFALHLPCLPVSFGPLGSRLGTGLTLIDDEFPIVVMEPLVIEVRKLIMNNTDLSF